MICLTEATAIPPPEKPTAEEPWTPLTCLKLADYYRGETLPESQRKESPYQKAVQAAISLVNKQGLTYQQVDAVLQYMKGVNETLKDDWWVDKKVDLWHVAEHGKAKLHEMERKAKHGQMLSAPPSASASERPSALLSEEKQQRNLERLHARVTAKRLQEQAAAAR